MVTSWSLVMSFQHLLCCKNQDGDGLEPQAFNSKPQTNDNGATLFIITSSCVANNVRIYIPLMLYVYGP